MIIYGLMILAGYLIGSIASAVLVCRMLGKDDPRNEGSQNPGATNVLRLHGKKAAVLTLLGDALKGFLPVSLVAISGAPDVVTALTALAAFLGHLFPVFFGFRGGKGVATFVGVLFGMYWILGISFALTWLIMAFIFRYSSLAALTAAVMTPLYSLWFYPSASYAMVNTLMAALLLWRHESNIRNLLSGKEDKLGANKSG
ncbi:MAG: glycerol-3-phosphate 1-O-acyltransferase PlsY [Gammaproteobacteria bacterium]|nr:glycerol-3-phosphate 1-O-acyltransferase PlsY [Gammaproteobacteria bacterium]